MTLPEKPLHVRVAEALGAKAIRYEEKPCHVGQTVCLRCSGAGDFPRVSNDPIIIGRWLMERWIEDEDVGQAIPAYDADWGATGPLLERYGITLRLDVPSLPGWTARAQRATCRSQKPLLAVCGLILALHSAGKLTTED